MTITTRRRGLARDSVANVSQIGAIDRDILKTRIGRATRPELELVLAGIDTILGR